MIVWLIWTVGSRGFIINSGLCWSTWVFSTEILEHITNEFLFSSLSAEANTVLLWWRKGENRLSILLLLTYISWTRTYSSNGSINSSLFLANERYLSDKRAEVRMWAHRRKQQPGELISVVDNEGIFVFGPTNKMRVALVLG